MNETEAKPVTTTGTEPTAEKAKPKMRRDVELRMAISKLEHETKEFSTKLLQGAAKAAQVALRDATNQVAQVHKAKDAKLVEARKLRDEGLKSIEKAKDLAIRAAQSEYAKGCNAAKAAYEALRDEEERAVAAATAPMRELYDKTVAELKVETEAKLKEYTEKVMAELKPLEEELKALDAKAKARAKSQTSTSAEPAAEAPAAAPAEG
jgi:hypothetical protein